MDTSSESGQASRQTTWKSAQIALGGNLGDVVQTFRQALDRLTGPDLRIVAVSSAYRTQAMGAAAGDAFLNAAAAVETTLTPESLLFRLLNLEIELGRVRQHHWGPRAIDLDLISHGDSRVNGTRLTLPHPGFWFRRFVLDPLCEIVPDATATPQLPCYSELRDALLPRPLPVALSGADATAIVGPLAAEFPEVEFFEAGPAAPESQLWQTGLRIDLDRPDHDPKRRIIGLATATDPAGLRQAVRDLLTAAMTTPERL